MVKKKNKSSGIKYKKLSVKDLKRVILNLYSRNSRKQYNAKTIIKKLKITNSKDAVQDALTKLARDKFLISLADHKFKLNNRLASPHKSKSQGKKYQGKVDMTRTGAAYIICEGLDSDVYVAANKTNFALNGDRVEVVVFEKKNRRKPEGEITKILKRSTEYFIGSVRLFRKYAVVIPDKMNMPVDIFVDLENTKEAKDGDKVVVKITKWPNRHSHSPIGQVTTVLGETGSHDIEMKAILINNGFNLDFPEEVIAESEALATEITEKEKAERRDMRKVTTFTIDPDTAKDFDDALSYEKKEDGSYEIGVHIADVTHYVRPGTALDKEAYDRSTSVYLVDRVLPMLPEMISNELCSLRPNEDKRTFSAVFTFGKNDKIINRWFGKTFTHSVRRFTYEEAQEVLETGKGDFAIELLELNRVAKKLRKKKFKNGAIAFEAEEVKFRLDEEGTPIDVYVKERKDAHMLIEDFMLLANKEVAKFIAKKGKTQEIPFVYRVHDLPNMDKVADFARFANELGFKIETQTPRQIADSFNLLTKEAKKNDALKILEPIAIRTMSKAVYTSDNIGHYGLGFEHYSHFTSPIRRYSDVLAHRILEKNLSGTFRVNKENLEAQCKHISAQERKAMDAERESTKYKQVEYIEKHVGEIFEGHISGMIDRGLFVELTANKVEGMVGFDTLNEAFDIANSRLLATGMRTKKVFRMGDTIKVKIVSANLAKKQVEMELVE